MVIVDSLMQSVHCHHSMVTATSQPQEPALRNINVTFQGLENATDHLFCLEGIQIYDTANSSNSSGPEVGHENLLKSYSKNSGGDHKGTHHSSLNAFEVGLLAGVIVLVLLLVTSFGLFCWFVLRRTKKISIRLKPRPRIPVMITEDRDVAKLDCPIPDRHTTYGNQERVFPEFQGPDRRESELEKTKRYYASQTLPSVSTIPQPPPSVDPPSTLSLHSVAKKVTDRVVKRMKNLPRSPPRPVLVRDFYENFSNNTKADFANRRGPSTFPHLTKT